MMDAEHYRNLLSCKGKRTVAFTLVASAVYAAKFGVCESEHIMNKDWLLIASRLKKSYGNSLSVQQTLTEMKSSQLAEHCISTI